MRELGRPALLLVNACLVNSIDDTATGLEMPGACTLCVCMHEACCMLRSTVYTKAGCGTIDSGKREVRELIDKQAGCASVLDRLKQRVQGGTYTKERDQLTFKTGIQTLR